MIFSSYRDIYMEICHSSDFIIMFAQRKKRPPLTPMSSQPYLNQHQTGANCHLKVSNCIGRFLLIRWSNPHPVKRFSVFIQDYLKIILFYQARRLIFKVLIQQNSFKEYVKMTSSEENCTSCLFLCVEFIFYCKTNKKNLNSGC